MKDAYKYHASTALLRDDEEGLLEWKYEKEDLPCGCAHKSRYTVYVQHLAYPSVRGQGVAYNPIDANRKARMECLRRMEDVLYRIDAWGHYSYAR
jgi:hypothetical protein